MHINQVRCAGTTAMAPAEGQLATSCGFGTLCSTTVYLPSNSLPVSVSAFMRLFQLECQFITGEPALVKYCSSATLAVAEAPYKYVGTGEGGKGGDD